MKKVGPWGTLFDELTVHEAALLAIGERPDKYARKDGVPLPENYAVSTLAVSRSVRSGRLRVSNARRKDVTPDGCPIDIDVHEPGIQFNDFKAWLAEHGLSLASLFSDEDATFGFEDRTHPRYAVVMHVAKFAWDKWETMDVPPLPGKSVLQNLEKIIRDHAAELQILKADGSVDEGIVKAAARAANWQRQGGCPATPRRDSTKRK